MCSHIFIIHKWSYWYYWRLHKFVCLNISGHFLFWNGVSCVPVRILHKDEKILGRKHIYLPHVQTAIYDSKVVIFKTGNIPSTWSWLNVVVRFECENSAIDVIINFLWKIFHKPIVLVVLTTANFGGFSNFCLYYTRSQTGKSTGYWPTLKPLITYYWYVTTWKICGNHISGHMSVTLCYEYIIIMIWEIPLTLFCKSHCAS